MISGCSFLLWLVVGPLGPATVENFLRSSETRIVMILKEADVGMKVKEICRKHGISDATYTTGSRSTAAWMRRI
jgi:putative transposase